MPLLTSQLEQKYFATSPNLPVNLRSVIIINGQTVPISLNITKWTCNLSTYGSPGTFEITTSLSNSPDIIGLVQETIKTPFIQDLNKLNNEKAWQSTIQQLVDVEIWVGYVDNPSNWVKEQLTRVFHGFIDITRWIYDKDELIIQGRDFSGLLMDTKAFVTTSEIDALSAQTSVSAVATKFAKQVNLQAIVEPAINHDGSPITIDFVYQNENIRGGIPRSKWDILLFLARAARFEVFVDPNKFLYFGPPPQPGLNSWKQLQNLNIDPKSLFNNLKFYWKSQDQQLHKYDSIKTIEFKHNPRRNKTFEILVKSYHPKSTQIVESRMVVLGIPITISSGKTVRAGIYRGQAEQTIFNELSSTFSQKNVPIYIFHKDGLNPTQAQQLAEEIAFDLAKREFIVDFTVLGNPNINNHSTIQFVGVDRVFSVTATGNVKRFEGIKFYPSSVEHSFGMDANGFTTKVQCLNIPPASTADPTQTFDTT